MPDLDDLRDRVNKFNALELPGQPMGMHMGTSYLVNDLLKAVEELSVSAPTPSGDEK